MADRPLKINGSKLQLALIYCLARYQGWFAGRQFGKSHAARERVKHLLCSRPGFNYLYIVPYLSQGAISIFEALVTDLAPYILRIKRQPYLQFWLKNGSYFVLRCWNKNPSQIRSLTVNEVFFDEIQSATHTDQFWSVLNALISVRRGRIIIAGQFRGHNWYYKDFFLAGQEGIPEAKADTKSWKLPSSEGLFFKTPEGRAELQRYRERMTPEDFAQEFECEPTANVNGAFRPSDLAYISRGTPLTSPRSSKHAYVMGLDLGRHSDPCGCVVIEVATGLIVHARSFPKGQEHHVSAKMALDISNKWNKAKVILDCTSGATGGHAPADTNLKFYRETLRGRIVKELYWGGRVQERIVQNTILMMEEAVRDKSSTFQLSIPNTPVFRQLHDELTTYEYKYRLNGYFYEAGEGAKDDLVAGFVQALWAINEKMVHPFINTNPGTLNIDTMPTTHRI